MTTTAQSTPAVSPPRPATHTLGVGRYTPFWFLLPAVFALAAIGLYPTIFAVVTSLRRYNITRTKDGFPFVGLENYQKVLTDDTFWGTLGTTARFFLTVMPIELVLGMGIALLLHRPGYGFLRALARVSLVVPLATTYAVVGLIGRLIFNRDFGVANQFISGSASAASTGSARRPAPSRPSRSWISGSGRRSWH